MFCFWSSWLFLLACKSLPHVSLTNSTIVIELKYRNVQFEVYSFVGQINFKNASCWKTYMFIILNKRIS